jgi:hypothetical protein
MIRRLALLPACLVSAGVLAVTGVARAETWRMGLELIHDWSLFTCPTTVGDRYWDFTLEGRELKARGPEEGMTWTTRVAADGSFKATYTAYFRGETLDAEMAGNVRTRRIDIHTFRDDCWYRLVPTPPY